MSIILNLLYFAILPDLYVSHPDFIGNFYSPEVGVGYAFGINLACTAIITLFFWRELFGVKWHFDTSLMRSMLSYTWPMLILGIAGILNQTADKMIFPKVYGDTQEGNVQLGIYGACVKIAMIMAMITQAFRYAYEPFVFSKSNDKDSKDSYAVAMKYFIIFTLLAFLCVVGYMDILKHIIGADYHEGLKVVPIVMAAEIMMGIYFNLSFWYKLIDKTIWGAWFSIAGCLVLVAVNIIFIPSYGYMACAWGGFAGYATSMLLSYFVGQKKYPVKYPLKSIGVYVFITILFFVAMSLQPDSWHPLVRMGINTVLILLFVAHIIHHDLPLKPILDRLRKRNA
jgi:O-antigen/teichoic acid export membrane protein